MSAELYSFSQLGWNHFFQQQLSLEELESTLPSRVFAVHRSSVDIICDRYQQQVSLPGSWYQNDPEELPTIGDWLLLATETGQPVRLLDRKRSPYNDLPEYALSPPRMAYSSTAPACENYN